MGENGAQGSLRATADSLVGRAGSWGLWMQGLGSPKAVAIPLVGGVGPQGYWLRGPRCSSAGVGLLVGKAGAWGVLGLVLVSWCGGWFLTRQTPWLWWSWGWCPPTDGQGGIQDILGLICTSA